MLPKPLPLTSIVRGRSCSPTSGSFCVVWASRRCSRARVLRARVCSRLVRFVVCFAPRRSSMATTRRRRPVSDELSAHLRERARESSDLLLAVVNAVERGQAPSSQDKLIDELHGQVSAERDRVAALVDQVSALELRLNEQLLERSTIERRVVSGVDAARQGACRAASRAGAGRRRRHGGGRCGGGGRRQRSKLAGAAAASLRRPRRHSWLRSRAARAPRSSRSCARRKTTPKSLRRADWSRLRICGANSPTSRRR
jgi:hypothetical protein